MLKIFNSKDNKIEDMNKTISLENFDKSYNEIISISLKKTFSFKQGNNHSKDRSEVAGSGKKLFKQKGTGNARAGNKKTTSRRGGGKAFGPKFHKVSFHVNKKVKSLSRILAIKNRETSDNVILFDENDLNEKFIKNNSLKSGFNLIISSTQNNNSELQLKFRNHRGITIVNEKNISLHSLLKCSNIFLSKNTNFYKQYVEKAIS